MEGGRGGGVWADGRVTMKQTNFFWCLFPEVRRSHGSLCYDWQAQGTNVWSCFSLKRSEQLVSNETTHRDTQGHSHGGTLTHRDTGTLTRRDTHMEGHTGTHTDILTRTHRDTHTHTGTHTDTLIQTHSDTHTFRDTHTQGHTRTHSYTHTGAHTGTLTHRDTHGDTHTQTHRDTNCLGPDLTDRFNSDWSKNRKCFYFHRTEICSYQCLNIKPPLFLNDSFKLIKARRPPEVLKLFWSVESWLVSKSNFLSDEIRLQV